MPGGGEPGAGGRPIVYCLVPRELAGKLHEPLRRHFHEDPTVEVVVEQRAHERRKPAARRAALWLGPARKGRPRAAERRRIRSPDGRRAGERRATLVSVPSRELPRRAQRHAGRLVFVERLEPATQQAEDLDTARLVTRIQAGDREAFTGVYMRHFDRVYAYLKIALDDRHEAEDATQQVFMKVLEALPAYERRPGRPFRAWLFTIARNYAVSELRKLNRIDTLEPDEMNRHRESPAEPDLQALGWISDRELMMFIERLPLAQRQVLVLKYMLDLPSADIGAILGRSPDDVRGLQSRALRFLGDRLTALGRGPSHGRAPRMRRVPKHAPVLRLRRFVLH